MLCNFSQLEFIILPEMEVRKISTFLIWSILTTGCLFDARDYKIPNELIILGYIGGLLLNLHSYQIMGVAIFITKAIWPILLLSLLTVVKGLGAGDVKLFSVMSTMVGAADLVTTFIYSVMIAGVIAIGLCIKNGHIVKRKLHYSYYIAAAFFLLQYKQG